MDVASITSAVTGLKAGKEILKSLYDIKVASDAREKIDEVMQKLGGAQDALFFMRESLFELQSENAELKKKIEDSESWENKLAGYDLVKTAGSAVVYQFKGTPEHYICPSCVENQRKEILQDNRNYNGRFRCVKCGAEYPINQIQSPPKRKVISRGYRF